MAPVDPQQQMPQLPRWTMHSAAAQMAYLVVRNLKGTQPTNGHATPMRAHRTVSSGGGDGAFTGTGNPRLARQPSDATDHSSTTPRGITLSPPMNESRGSFALPPGGGGSAPGGGGRNASGPWSNVSPSQRFIQLCQRDPLTTPCALTDSVPLVSHHNAPLLVALLWAACELLPQLVPAAQQTARHHRRSPAPEGGAGSVQQPPSSGAQELINYATSVAEGLVQKFEALHEQLSKNVFAPCDDTEELLGTIGSFCVRLGVRMEAAGVSQAASTLGATGTQPPATRGGQQGAKIVGLVRQLVPTVWHEMELNSVSTTILRSLALLPRPLHCTSLAMRLSELVQSFINEPKGPRSSTPSPAGASSPQDFTPQEDQVKKKVIAALIVESFRKVLPVTSAHVPQLLNSLLVPRYIHRAFVSATIDHATIVASALDLAMDSSVHSRQRSSWLHQLWDICTDLLKVDSKDRHRATNGEAVVLVVNAAAHCLEYHTVHALNAVAAAGTGGSGSGPSSRSVSPAVQPRETVTPPGGHDATNTLSDALSVVFCCLLSPTSVANLEPDLPAAKSYIASVRRILLLTAERLLSGQRAAELIASQPGATLRDDLLNRLWSTLREPIARETTEELCSVWGSQLVMRLREPISSGSAAAHKYLSNACEALRLIGRYGTGSLVESIVVQLSDSIVDHSTNSRLLSGSGVSRTGVEDKDEAQHAISDTRSTVMLLQLDLLLSARITDDGTCAAPTQQQQCPKNALPGIPSEFVDAVKAFCGTASDLLEHDSRSCVTSLMQAMRRAGAASEPLGEAPPAPGSSTRNMHLHLLTETSALVTHIVKRIVAGAPDDNPAVVALLREELMKRLIEGCSRLAWPTSSPLQHLTRNAPSPAHSRRVAKTALSPFVGAIARIIVGNTGAPVENFNSFWILCVWYGFVNIKNLRLSLPGAQAEGLPRNTSTGSLHAVAISDAASQHSDTSGSNIPQPGALDPAPQDLSGWGPCGLDEALAVIAKEAPPFLSFTSQGYVRAVNEISALERRSGAAGIELKTLQTEMASLIQQVDSSASQLCLKLSFAEVFLLRCTWELELLRGAQCHVLPSVSYHRYEMKTFEAPPELKQLVIPCLTNACCEAAVTSLRKLPPNEQTTVLSWQMQQLLLDSVLCIAPIRLASQQVLVRLLTAFPQVCAHRGLLHILLSLVELVHHGDDEDAVVLLALATEHNTYLSQARPVQVSTDKDRPTVNGQPTSGNCVSFSHCDMTATRNIERETLKAQVLELGQHWLITGRQYVPHLTFEALLLFVTQQQDSQLSGIHNHAGTKLALSAFFLGDTEVVEKGPRTGAAVLTPGRLRSFPHLIGRRSASKGTLTSALRMQVGNARDAQMLVGAVLSRLKLTIRNVLSTLSFSPVLSERKLNDQAAYRRTTTTARSHDVADAIYLAAALICRRETIVDAKNGRCPLNEILRWLVEGPVHIFGPVALSLGAQCWKWVIHEHPSLAPHVLRFIVTGWRWTRTQRLGLFDGETPQSREWIETGGKPTGFQGDDVSKVMPRSHLYAEDYSSNSPHRILCGFLAELFVDRGSSFAFHPSVHILLLDLVRDSVESQGKNITLKHESFSEFFRFHLLCLAVIRNAQETMSAGAQDFQYGLVALGELRRNTYLSLLRWFSQLPNWYHTQDTPAGHNDIVVLEELVSMLHDELQENRAGTGTAATDQSATKGEGFSSVDDGRTHGIDRYGLSLPLMNSLVLATFRSTKGAAARMDLRRTSSRGGSPLGGDSRRRASAAGRRRSSPAPATETAAWDPVMLHREALFQEDVLQMGNLLELLILLARHELLRLRVWIGGHQPSDLSAVRNLFEAGYAGCKDDTSFWKAIVTTAHQHSPAVAIQLPKRFPFDCVRREITNLVNERPKDFCVLGEAVDYYIPNEPQGAIPDLASLPLWANCPLTTALRFLAPRYAKHKQLVAYAFRSLSARSGDCLTFFLPQLVQALRCQHDGLLAELLIDISKRSDMGTAHQVLWALQTEIDTPEDENGSPPNPNDAAALAQRAEDRELSKRCKKLMEDIRWSFSADAIKLLDEEVNFVDNILALSGILKPVEKPQRKERLRHMLRDSKFQVPDGSNLYVPTNPDCHVLEVLGKNSSPMQSAAKCPILVPFRCQKAAPPGGESVSLEATPQQAPLMSNEDFNPPPPQPVFTRACIFKMGDDCRQDQLAVQLFEFLRRIFDSVNLPFYLYPYRVITTGKSSGIIECVPNATSRNDIGKMVEGNLAEYFVQQYGHPESTAFKQARECFVRSMASYSVASFVLNIKDRHNGNILLDGEGHLVHIDFGFMFDFSPGGDINFERSPFKLTMEMLQLMGGGAVNPAEPLTKDMQNSEVYASFVRATTRCFLALRDYTPELCVLVELMLTSGLPCFKPKQTILDLRERLAVGKSEVEAVEFIHEKITRSRDNIRTLLYDRYQNIREGIEM